MWVLYALLTAFFLATSDALTKELLWRYTPWQILWIRFSLAAIFLLPLLFLYPIPRLPPIFWVVVGIDLPLEVLAVYLYLKAIECSPISLSLPFLSFTPLFLLFTSRVMMGEEISTQATIGILMVVAGSYSIQLGKAKKGILEPFFSFGKEKGPLFMLIVAFIYSITSNLGKVAITNSSPQFFSLFLSTELAVASLLLLGREKRVTPKPLKDLKLAWMALFFALHILFHTLALNLAKVSYMISLKRTSALFAVIYGRLLYREERIGERLLGASLMVTGAILISLAP